MDRVLLKELSIKNFGPIKGDSVSLEPFTYFVGRNNAGKSHYLRAIELLLSPKHPSADEIFKFQNDKAREIIIEGTFEGVQNFAASVTKSNHKEAIEAAIRGGLLRVVRILDSQNTDKNVFGVRDGNGEIANPAGFTGNLLKVLPEPISIVATADTVDELKSKGNTAIMKLKKEVLASFLEQLKTKTKEAFAGLNEFLHSDELGKRSAELVNFEKELHSELAGEFADVIPSVEFGLPDEEVIAQEMRLFLDDGYRSEVEQKGHGLQRATLLALLRLLARQGERYRERPAPIFLVGELETFLHPYAQRLLANTLSSLVDRYQIITTTHSPFIIDPKNIVGYRRVIKKTDGSKSVMPNWKELDLDAVKRHLEWRGNLEGLFGDRIILIEGEHDENFFEKLRSIFKIPYPPKKLTLFVKTSGRKKLRTVRDFYLKMGFDDVAVIADLDCLFAADTKQLLEAVGLDSHAADGFRDHIEWTDRGDPSLEYVVRKTQEKGPPPGFERAVRELEGERIFILRHGSPEMYYKVGMGNKLGWTEIEKKDDLNEPGYLETLINKLLIP
jgi:predicted ATP-dependent endonuclease of OLD family